MANSRQSATIFSPSSKRPTKRTRSSITEHSFQGITPSPKGKKCHPCVRYKVSPMCQAAQISKAGDQTLAFSFVQVIDVAFSVSYESRKNGRKSNPMVIVRFRRAPATQFAD